MNPYLFASYLFRCKNLVNMNRIFRELGTRVDLNSVQKLLDSLRRVDKSHLKKVYHEHIKKHMSTYF
jgi:hypothetical protein